MNRRERKRSCSRKTVLVLALWTLVAMPATIAQPEPAESPEELKARADGLLAAYRRISEIQDIEAARRDLEEAQDLYVRLDDVRGQIDALLQLGVVYAKAEDRPEMTARYRQALPLLAAAEDHLGVWSVRMILGEVTRGDPAAAEAQYREALAALDKLREPGTPIYLDTLATLGDQVGLPAEVFRSVAPLIDLMRPMLLRQCEGATQLSLSAAFTAAGEYEQASAAIAAARELSPFGLLDKEIEHARQRLETARAQASGAAESQPTTAAESQPSEGAGVSERSPQEPTSPEADELLADLGPITGDTDLGRARSQLEAAFALYEQADDRNGRMICLLLLAKVRDKMDGHAAAMEVYRRAWKLVEAEGTSFERWLVQINMGGQERSESRDPEALAHLERALEHLRAVRRNREPIPFDLFLRVAQHAGIALPPDGMPMAELWKSKMSEGLEQLMSQGPLREMIRPLMLDFFEGETLAELGNALVAMERYDEAEAYLDQTLSFPNPNMVRARARLRQRQDEYQAAQDLYEQAWSMLEDLDLPSWLTGGKPLAEMHFDPTSILDDIDELSWMRGQPRDLSHWQQALDRARRDNDPVREAQVLLGLGEAHLPLGRMEEAEPLFEEALVLARKIGRRDLEARALDGLGMVHLISSRYEEAIRSLEQALEIHRRRGNRAAQVNALSALGTAYTIVGSGEQALRILQDAQRLAQELGDSFMEAGIRQQIATIPVQLGADDPELAVDQALLYWLHRADRRYGIIADTMLSLAKVSHGQEHGEQALERARQGLVLAQELGSPSFEMMSRLALAMELFHQGRCLEARLAFEELLAVHRETTSWDELESMALGGLAALMGEEGDAEGAIALLGQGIERLEQVQAQVRVEDLLASLIDTGRYALYDAIIEALAQRGEAGEAFAYAERARARAFLRQIGNVRLDRGRVGDPALVAEAEDLRHRAIDLERELARMRKKLAPFGGDPRAGELQRELDESRLAYQHMRVRLRLSDPEYASLVGVEPISPEVLQNDVLDDETTLVAFYVHGARTLAWVMDRETVHMVSIGFGREALAAGVKYFRNLIAARKPEAETVAGTLHRILIGPLVPHIRHPNLIVVPHGVLHFLPFAALRDADRGRYLVEDYTLTYSPSASVLPFLAARQTPNEGRALVLGNPDGSLRHAAAEATAIAELLGGAPVVGAAATESLIYAHAGEIDLLHLGAHASYDGSNPLFSRIALTADEVNDGNLEVHEIIERLDLSGVNLVVLSACSTALGEQTRGDELVGLTRAFLHAGTPAVVTTLWSIEDQASAALMEAFYRHLRDGAPAAAALRSAQLEVMGQEGWRAPYYWAAFALSGDGRGHWSGVGGRLRPGSGSRYPWRVLGCRIVVS